MGVWCVWVAHDKVPAGAIDAQRRRVAPCDRLGLQAYHSPATAARWEATMDRACIIGAGSSGIAAGQVLQERGIPFDCFETGSAIGGNWRYLNDNGMSSAYRSLHINTSKKVMEYASFPMPDDYPNYPNQFQVCRYFDDLSTILGCAIGSPSARR
jgi:heterodisulfide reductase subunit A-like polyferredoxin